MRTTLIACAALAVLVAAPTVVSADDAPKISYSAKKQGKVAFKDRSDEQTTAAQDMYDGQNPADIEPAAGGYEPELGSQTSSVAESIKLPRKN